MAKSMIAKTPAMNPKSGRSSRGSGPATINTGKGYKETKGTRGPKTSRGGSRKK